MRYYIFKNSGFTLIELLVVISIISFLSSVVLSSLSSARMKARDTQRISDIRQMRIALELYKSANGDYPNSSSGMFGLYYISNDATWSTFQTALSPYMSRLPVDPKNTGTFPWVTNGYVYVYGYRPGSYSYSLTKKYDLVAQFENSSHPLRSELKGWIQQALDAPWYPTYTTPIYTGEY